VRVLTVNRTDIVGRRFNGFDLQRALNAEGHRCEMLVWTKDSNDPAVYQMKRGPLRALQALWSRLMRLSDMDGIVSPAGLVLPFQEQFRRADIIHSHYVDVDMLGALLMPAVSRMKPLVWTLHSAIGATGTCYHPYECRRWHTGCTGRCPHPRGVSPLRYRTPALHWQIKNATYRRTNATVVVASRWTRRFVEQSPFLRHMPVHQIPFGIDLGTFHPIDKPAARALLGIPADAHVLAFRGMRGQTRGAVFKGSAELRQALKLLRLTRPTVLLIIQDAEEFQRLSGKYQIAELGTIDSSARMAAALSAADLFLMPSRGESFGLMAVESMACATPVVVAEGTALPDVVHAPEGGVAVPAGSPGALAEAITALLADDARRLHIGHAARRIAEREYGFDLYVRRHLALYEDVLRRHGGAIVRRTSPILPASLPLAARPVGNGKPSARNVPAPAVYPEPER
jgi:glycosyltransferase involved in cell wall biosynthesis